MLVFRAYAHIVLSFFLAAVVCFLGGIFGGRCLACGARYTLFGGSEMGWAVLCDAC